MMLEVHRNDVLEGLGAQRPIHKTAQALDKLLTETVKIQ